MVLCVHHPFCCRCQNTIDRILSQFMSQCGFYSDDNLGIVEEEDGLFAVLTCFQQEHLQVLAPLYQPVILGDFNAEALEVSDGSSEPLPAVAWQAMMRKQSAAINTGGLSPFIVSQTDRRFSLQGQTCLVFPISLQLSTTTSSCTAPAWIAVCSRLALGAASNGTDLMYH
jgi:hypothetical protein